MIQNLLVADSIDTLQSSCTIHALKLQAIPLYAILKNARVHHQVVSMLLRIVWCYLFSATWTLRLSIFSVNYNQRFWQVEISPWLTRILMEFFWWTLPHKGSDIRRNIWECIYMRWWATVDVDHALRNTRCDTDVPKDDFGILWCSEKSPGMKEVNPISSAIMRMAKNSTLAVKACQLLTISINTGQLCPESFDSPSLNWAGPVLVFKHQRKKI